MLTLYLIRHGQKEKTTPDPSLTELGHEQAKKTAEFLAQKPISKIVASPMLRTQQTAKHIATATGLELHTDVRLKERMDYGDYKETTFNSFVKEWKKATENREYKPQWGDSSLNTGKRIAHLIDELHSGGYQHVVLVTHGGAIADFLKNTFDIDDIVTKLPHVTLRADFDIKECSITTVMTNGSKYELSECHYVSHLE